jgi:TonB family protein
MAGADRAANPRLRKSLSVAASAGLHSWILAWVILGEPGPAAPVKSIYDQEIRPSERKIVWYDLKEKLPRIAPAAAPLSSQPLRASVKSEHSIVAGERDLAKPATLIFSAVPEAPVARQMPLPNVVTVASPPAVIRPFEPPPATPAPRIAPPNLPEPPRVAAVEAGLRTALPVSVAGPKPEPRAFTPPPVTRLQRQAAILLPEAPAVASLVEPNALPFSASGPKPRPRDFVAPETPKRTAVPSPALPAAPDVAASPRTSATALDRLPRTFVPSPNRPANAAAPPAVLVESPAVPGAPAQATLAIISLNPSKSADLPKPPESRPAGFSAGAELRPEGAAAPNTMPLVNVPGLTVGEGSRDAKPGVLAPFSPTSRENLMAAARSAAPATPRSLAPPDPRASRVSSAPDIRFSGREVYSIAIQMPNITSFSGSWLVWFAARDVVPLGPGAPAPVMRPPVPLRKVDPKYIASAAAERVEGRVRLFGVIGKSGHVDGISVLQHLDDRLDSSASEALAKWEFTPAMLNGVPVDVEAVFEIPFHLAPRPTK